MTALLLGLAAVALGMAISALFVGVWRPTVVDRHLPTPKITEEMAAFVGLVRRDGETASAFEGRVFAAHRELSDASTEFMNAASQLGHFDVANETYRSEAERVEAIEVHGRCVTHRLPPDHPAAVRYTIAKRGDQRPPRGSLT